MEIVIEIADVAYDYIKRGCPIPITIDNHIYDAIRKATPLPKEHGRLIDVEALYDDFENAIEYAPTIIPAHEEE